MTRPAPNSLKHFDAVLFVMVCSATAGLAAAVYMTQELTVMPVAAAVFGILASAIVWRRPELGLVALSFLSAGLVPLTLSKISMGPIHCDVADIILFVLLVLGIHITLLRGSLQLYPWSISSPVLAFGGLALMSALYAVLYQGVQPGLVIGELRPALYFSGAAIVMALVIRRQRQLIVLLGGLFMVADIIAAMIMLQQFSHDVIVATPPAGIWQVDIVTELGGGLGSVRVVPPGHVLVYLMANLAFCLTLGALRTPRQSAFFAFQSIVLTAALLVTYTRAQWLASSIALVLALVLLPSDTKRQVKRRLKVIVPLLSVLVTFLMFSPISLGVVGLALIQRAASVFTPEETLGTASLEWRSFEVSAAIQAISDHPWFGVGLGNVYRSITLVQGEASGWLWKLDGSEGQLTRFIHNGYLYLAVKMGLPGLGVLLWFGLALVLVGLPLYRRMSDGWLKLTILGSICSFVGLLGWTNLQPHLMLPNSMATVGFIAGIVIVGAHLYDERGRLANDGATPPEGETA